MKQEPLAPSAGNGRRTRMIEFDEADAPMLMAAMRLAAATARHYGMDQRKAMARLQHYQQLFMAFAPPESQMFDEEETWCEIAIAMDSAPEFSVKWKGGGWPDYHKGRATVTIGRRSWTTGHCATITQEQAEELAIALDTLAPAGCIRVVSTSITSE